MAERVENIQYGWSKAESRHAAGRVVKRALERGHIKRPKRCPICKAVPGVDAQGNPKIQAVHLNGYSYEHRLDFKWMCVSCRSKAVWARKRLA